MRSLLTTLAAILALMVFGVASEASARTHHRHQYRSYHHFDHAAFRHYARHHRRHYARRGGRCDGFHGCRCGVTAARLHGLPLNYKGHNLKQAHGYVEAFPRSSSPAPGNIVYQHGGGPTGHVSTIKQVLSRCEAVVADDRGTYQRNICSRGAIILAVNG